MKVKLLGTKHGNLTIGKDCKNHSAKDLTLSAVQSTGNCVSTSGLTVSNITDLSIRTLDIRSNDLMNNKPECLDPHKLLNNGEEGEYTFEGSIVIKGGYLDFYPTHSRSCVREHQRSPKKVNYKDIHGPSVYILYHYDDVVYVGQSINPISRIGTHSKDKKFTHFRILRCARSRMGHWEKKLIQEYRPCYNISGNPNATRKKYMTKYKKEELEQRKRYGDLKHYYEMQGLKKELRERLKRGDKSQITDEDIDKRIAARIEYDIRRNGLDKVRARYYQKLQKKYDVNLGYYVSEGSIEDMTDGELKQYFFPDIPED